MKKNTNTHYQLTDSDKALDEEVKQSDPKPAEGMSINRLFKKVQCNHTLFSSNTCS